MKRYYTTGIVKLAAALMFCCLVVSCGQASPPTVATPLAQPTILATRAPTLAAPSATAAIVPATTTATSVPATPAPRPTATSVPAASTPSPAVKLQTDNFEFTVPVTEDDLGPIIAAFENLSGVTDVQGGGNGIQVTYDPQMVSHKQLVDLIAGYGFHVKE